MELTPPGDPSKSVLEMGAHKEAMERLKFHFGYGTVRGCGDGPLGYVDTLTIVREAGEAHQCSIDLFNPEKDPYPYAEESFDTVICSELLETLSCDPMHMMSEANRILKPDGYFVLATPNIGSLRSIAAILLDRHPAVAAGYTRTRHNREYVTMEIHHLFEDAGFRLVEIQPGESNDQNSAWVMPILKRYNLNQEIRGDRIYALAQKSGPVKNRWPSWLYA
jgi:SAM-dependent methyltransferase